ncbi:prolipoprotein diacylglyceryl transferase [Psychromicrobium xiongbiense]|uniref:prolipoprotein diacylglyceryl transferase n=1 Tax=Psychromicrobium xiongbiense TaxID=3051184 RepID=UPI0025559F5B|nr:prolipoprotein diacylglyceryl transferase [Psychromicrobium sp. YIM S02556]
MSTLAGLTGATAPVSIPSPQWSGFVIPLPGGSWTIHAYALCILVGIIAALWLTGVRWKRRGAPEGSLWDIAIWAIPFGIIGGRLYHVFSSPDLYFGPGYNGHGEPWKIIQIWEGGLGIWGAVVLGVLGAWIGCRRAGVKLSALLDAAAPGLLLAQALGRWGNYFNQELFGGPTTLPWGLQVDPNSPNFPHNYPADTLFHPTFLYEMIWNILGVVVLLLLDRKLKFRDSRLFWLYAMYYTAGRVWIEALRIDDAQQITLFGLTTRLNVWTSILVFLAALLIFVVLTVIHRVRKKRGTLSERDNSVLLREPAMESAVEPDAPAATDETDAEDADSERQPTAEPRKEAPGEAGSRAASGDEKDVHDADAPSQDETAVDTHGSLAQDHSVTDNTAESESGSDRRSINRD